jgi:hypothetical protein
MKTPAELLTDFTDHTDFFWVYLNLVERQTLRVSVVDHESPLTHRNPKGLNRL